MNTTKPISPNDTAKKIKKMIKKSNNKSSIKHQIKPVILIEWHKIPKHKERNRSRAEKGITDWGHEQMP